MLNAAVWQETVRRAGSEGGGGYDLDRWIWGEGGGLDLKGRAAIRTPGSGEREEGRSSPARVIWLPPAPSAPLHSTE